LVPIPNVLGDPGDHEWPLDVVLLPRDWLAGVLEIARRARHPFSAAFAEHFQPVLEPRFDPRAATRAFQALAASGDRRAALAALLASASRLAVGEGHPPSRPVPFHSGRYLLSVLEAAFAGRAAFRIELAEIATRSAWRPRLPGAPRYRSLCLGHQRIADELPARLLDPARARPARPGVAAGPEEDALTEVGVFVCAARRVP
jgi:hypothetical protein